MRESTKSRIIAEITRLTETRDRILERARGDADEAYSLNPYSKSRVRFGNAIAEATRIDTKIRKLRAKIGG